MSNPARRASPGAVIQGYELVKPEILVLLPIFAPTLAALEQQYVVHKLWAAPDRDALIKEVAPRVRAVVTTGLAGCDVATMQALPKQGNRIAGAGLDVFWDEPHVPAALMAMDNVVLAPHIGASTQEVRVELGRKVLENLQAHFAGQAVPYPVPGEG